MRRLTNAPLAGKLPAGTRRAASALAGVIFMLSASVAIAGQEPPYIYSSDGLAPGQTMTSWLICGPFPNSDVQDTPTGEWVHDARCVGLYTDFLVGAGGESSIAPQAGLKVPAPDGQLHGWTSITAAHDQVFLGDYMSPTINQIAYAACWIDRDQPEDILMGLGSSDGIRIWVNGTETFRVHEGRPLALDDNYFRLPLVAGRNQVLVKIENGDGRWGFALRPVDNVSAVKALIPRLKDVLRFDYQKNETGYTVTFGDPTIVGNLENLSEAKVAIETSSGEQAGMLTVSLGRPFFIPYSDYEDESYQLSGEVLWPYRGKVTTSGLLYRGDLRSEVVEMLQGTQPELIPSRASDAYTSLLGTTRRADRLNRLNGESQAYAWLKDGLTQALQGAVGLQNSNDPYGRLFPKPRNVGTSSNEMVQVTGDWTLSIADSIFDDELDDSLVSTWTAYTDAQTGTVIGQVYVLALETDFLATPTLELRSDDTEYKEPAESIRERVPTNPEGYAIQITGNRIVVAGRTARGAGYGMDTLLQLLAQSTTLPTATIIDEPVYPTRAMVIPLEGFDNEFRAAIDEAAKLRQNTVFLPSSLYPDLEDTEIQPILKEAYAYCRARFVEPIPLVETFGDKTLAATIDPNFLEGLSVRELPVEVDDLRRVHLPYDRILMNESTMPQLRTAKGYNVLRLDRDFVFESVSPPIIQLKGKAPVQTGETLLLTADVVDLSIASNGASCPSDTGVWLLTEKIIQGIYTHLAPVGIHLGQTGVGYLNRDSRCLAREMPNALLLADAVQKSHDIVKNIDEKATLYMWGDQFSPFQRAQSLDAIQAAEYLPKDIIVLDWWFKGATAFDRWRVEQGLRYFDQFGLKTLGVVRDDPLNIQQFATMNIHFSQRFKGIVHQNEGTGNDGRYLAAEAGWQGSTSLGTPLTD